MINLHQIFDGYDLGIHRVDEHAGKIFEALKIKGVFDDFVIIISSDHGENFGELGIFAEHSTANQFTSRIPMIIRWPGYTSGKIVKGFHYNLDLLPPLAEMIGINPLPSWDGMSFAPALKSDKFCGRNYLVLSQCAHVCQRSVLFDKWIYIRSYHDGFHLFPTEMLFDLDNYPHEQTNLANVHQDFCKQAVYYLNEWHDKMMMSMDEPIDPLWVVMKEGGPYHTKGALKNYCARLEGTERAWAIEQYSHKYPGEFT
jgi:choline-sulfatase